MTQEHARNLAINIASRLRGLEKIMQSPGADWVTIHFDDNGDVRICIDKEMANTDVLMYSFRGNLSTSQLDHGTRAILDQYGNEVA